MSNRAVVGVMDIGGGHVTAALIDPAEPGQVLAEAAGSLDPHAPREVLLAGLAAPARSLLSDGSAAAPTRWAIAIPGPFDAAAGVGSFEGVDKFRSIAGVDLRAEFAMRLGTTTDRIGFLNDAVAYGIGEWATGAGEHAARLLCVTLGTGVGSAFLADGHEVDGGPDVPPNGDAHRIEIDGVPLERVMSSPAIRDAFRERTGQERTVAEVCAAARAGDDDAMVVVDAALGALGRALAPWVQRFGATRVVVGGAIAGSWDVIAVPLGRGLAAGAPTIAPELVPARLGARAPLVGAAAWAA
ncbi:ROK family protein [Curtobacterium sp. Leaf261]|uniref:ROK family protein n=1 Tax=Curtobacterium sp. Leaf261 TaxID=1736311 RepID=UPI00190FD5AB|nr:ROK family protein [Curtobacterium sp. Leaf261]